jgi:formate dehydrogenase subunit beta
MHMDTQWVLNTKGDPLGTVNHFVRKVWQETGLEGVILPSDRKNEVRVVDDPVILGEFNPFQPLMLMNIAGLIPPVLKEHPGGKYGIVLRPCELRALNEVADRNAIDPGRLLTICVDCLGTFADEEFEWRSIRKGSDAGLTKEALQFAPQGGINAYRYRAACQMCKSPGAKTADINLGVLGLPVRQSILVDGEADLLDWSEVTDKPADPALSERRNVMLSKLVERHSQTRERVLEGLAEVLPVNVDVLLDQFEGCGSCQSCMDACPICSVEIPRRARDGRYERQDVVEWLVDCAGCGMCEQSCPKHMPLSIIFTHVKQSLEDALAA